MFYRYADFPAIRCGRENLDGAAAADTILGGDRTFAALCTSDRYMQAADCGSLKSLVVFG